MIFKAYAQKKPERIDEIQRATTIATNLHHEGLKTKGEE